MNINLGLQLYTLRNVIDNDLRPVLKKVAEIGYNGVEFAGFYGLSAEETRSLLKQFGLQSIVSHTPMEELMKNIDEVIKYNQTIGTKYIVCPYWKFASRDEYLEKADFFNNIGRQIKENGMLFGYHNHANEFESYDGIYGLDLLFQNTYKDCVMFQLDVYWVTYAGLDPVAYINNYAGRCPVIHLKDMKNITTKEMTEAGQGIIDMGRIINAGLRCGVKWFSVEQDDISIDPIESVTISHNTIRSLGI